MTTFKVGVSRTERQAEMWARGKQKSQVTVDAKNNRGMMIDMESNEAEENEEGEEEDEEDEEKKGNHRAFILVGTD